jgi:hypothetical protein
MPGFSDWLFAVPDCVKQIVRAGAPAKIDKTIVCWIVIAVQPFASIWT